LLGRRSGYQGVLPVGRVQTPTLRLVVDRDRSIAAFVPVPWWGIDVRLCAAGQVFTAQWQAPKAVCDEERRCLQQPIADAAVAKMSQASQASVTDVRTERIKEGAPLPFDLGTLQQVCSRKLSLGAQETLDIAQALYDLQGHHLPAQRLRLLAGKPAWGGHRHSGRAEPSGCRPRVGIPLPGPYPPFPCLE